MSPKTAIITGAGQGIGLAIARSLVASGANVVLNDMDPELARAAGAALGGKVLVVAGDASRQEIIDEMVAGAVSRFGGLDIVIANAGITLFGQFLAYNREDFSRVAEVNLGGSFFLAQAAARQMMIQARGGSILFMSSVTASRAHRDLAAYGMTKAGLEALARHLALELGSAGINVNAIAPGATATERTLSDPSYASTWASLTPMGRAASVEDIAKTAAFLVSDAAKHISGQTIIVDGGWSAMSPGPESV